jgi:hypothetical protein
MRLKSKQEIVRDLFKRYIYTKENIIYGHKLFVISSIINYIYEGDDEKNKYNLMVYYSGLIDRYLKDELDLYWQDGRIQVEEVEKET